MFALKRSIWPVATQTTILEMKLNQGDIEDTLEAIDPYSTVVDLYLKSSIQAPLYFYKLGWAWDLFLKVKAFLRRLSSNPDSYASCFKKPSKKAPKQLSRHANRRQLTLWPWKNKKRKANPLHLETFSWSAQYNSGY